MTAGHMDNTDDTSQRDVPKRRPRTRHPDTAIEPTGEGQTGEERGDPSPAVAPKQRAPNFPIEIRL